MTTSTLGLLAGLLLTIAIVTGGFVGLLLAVPLAAIVGVLTRFALARYLDSPLYTGHGAALPPPGSSVPLPRPENDA